MSSSPGVERQTRRARWMAALRGRLASPRAPWLAALLGMVLAAPSLVAGLNTDDLFHRVSLTTPEGPLSRQPWDVYSLAPTPQAPLSAYLDLGLLPWWTPTDAILRVWRPLSSLSHALDHAWLGLPPWAMHLENLLWYGALILAVGALYRRMLPVGGWAPWVAGLATLLYAVDDAHGQAVGWIANRNALMGATFGVLALLAHDRWRRDGWRPGAALGPLALMAALASTELAISTLAYLGAYALCMDAGSWRSRLASVAPWAAVVVAWRVGCDALGYVSRGAGLFLDPLDVPGLFLREAPSRAAALVFGQWGWVPSDLWVAVPEGEGHLVVIGGALVFLALIGVVAWPALRRDPAARFLALGSLGSLLPACATFPMDRLLLFAGVGAMGIIAQVVAMEADQPPWRPEAARWRRRARLLAVSWAVIHLGLASALLPLRALTQHFLSPSFEALSQALPDRPELAGETVVVVAAPDFWSAGLTPVVRRARGQVAPARTRVLATGFEGLTIARPDDRTLRVSRPEGVFTDPIERLLYGDHRQRPEGTVLVIDGMEATIEARAADGRPSVVSYRFDQGLESPGLRPVIWRPGGYRAFELPPVGGEVVLEAMPIEAIFAPGAEGGDDL